jgi:peptidyl-tRNA hydrolase, PTH1 family
MRLIAGLGNPGAKYEETRHNMGFKVADAMAQAFSIPIAKKKFNAVFGKGRLDGMDILIAKPVAFMNRSGPPVLGLAHYFGIEIKDIIVIYDDVDLDFGRIKIKEKGGDGGHKGLKSVIDVFGDDGFARVRLGIGRPAAHMEVADYVLGKFSRAENKSLPEIINRARDVMEVVLKEGANIGMNRFNAERFIIKS